MYVSVLLMLLIGLGIGLFIAAKGELSYLVYTISAQQSVIFKLSMFAAGVLLEYVLVNASLVWDYELIKTYEV